jgi:hypothetical protein
VGKGPKTRYFLLILLMAKRKMELGMERQWKGNGEYQKWKQKVDAVQIGASSGLGGDDGSLDSPESVLESAELIQPAWVKAEPQPAMHWHQSSWQWDSAGA